MNFYYAIFSSSLRFFLDNSLQSIILVPPSKDKMKKCKVVIVCLFDSAPVLTLHGNYGNTKILRKNVIDTRKNAFEPTHVFY